MKLPQNLEPLSDPLESLHNLLVRFHERGVIIGGVATGFLGRPRFTEDIDAMVIFPTEQIPLFLSEAAKEGIQPRITDVEDFARRNRILLLKHVSSDTPIDISIGILLFEEETVERSKVYNFDGLKLRLPTPEDLIVMKAVAHRPKDLEDIRSIVEKQKKLDKVRIEFWVKNFAEILELPDLWDQINKILKG
jgi:predicted nucleotidyltransferase